MSYYHKMCRPDWRLARSMGRRTVSICLRAVGALQERDVSRLEGPVQTTSILGGETAALAIPNTGMAVTTDISVVENIHPPNKQDVGDRLARWALANTYGRTEIPFSGPRFRYSLIEPGQVPVFFDTGGEPP